ncbi:CGNR zinc finger domain-containing protein [Paractinoplanes lichenicola]|uniref:CGNR zinc finger domain-containing protein n=1 Tax=Paractinoplanes lichenicola TaxID=2802976 RepID=A0ABS1VYG5_9ACTN|nr:CGNR zinc finger domain-containing protein [Actinoplanes lichenicola]MBL7259537.1 CGNR zinc finger domain-containing protein [Actinoplanes lichenicola]
MNDVLLLTLLNSTPMIDGVRTETLRLEADDQALLRAGRDTLQDVVRGTRPASALTPFLQDVVSHPAIENGHLTWTVSATNTRALLIEAIEAWDELERSRPGRLRPCANAECALFLLDRSKSNSARWCSMSSCGNKLKARRHYQRKTTGNA